MGVECDSDVKMQGYNAFILLLIFSAYKCKESPIGCAEHNVACIAHEDNLVESLSGITDVEECRQLCHDEESCEFLTYYDATSFPRREVCFLLKDCMDQEPCVGCVSEPRKCFQYCILPYTGVLDENILEIIPDVTFDLDCRRLCLAIQDCTYYTYFTDIDQCYLLSKLLEPLQPCVNCVTGKNICTDADSCLILYNGTLQKSAMFEDTENSIDVTLLAQDHCEVRMFLVGGGGQTNNYRGSGSGSGYLKYSSKTLTETKTVQLNVGDQGEASQVILDGVTIEALPGESDTYDNSNYYGGNGFSGGGGFCECEGGHDGSDGAGDEDINSNGGKGTGEKLSSFPMESFILTPGVGGQHYSNYGGGGGGVLVDGAGPAEWDVNQGQGYGGGGCYYNSQGDRVQIGLSGVILMEM